MQKKKINYIVSGVISLALILTTIISLHITQTVQANNFVGKGYYQVFKDDEIIGNIKNIDEIKKELLLKYGDKINQDVYFGDGISIEHVPYTNQVVNFDDSKEMIDILDVRIDGLRVNTSPHSGGKEFYVTSYHDWQKAISETIHFIANNDAEKFQYDDHAVPGDIKVVETFYYTYEKIPIDEIMDLKETKEKIIYENTNNLRKDIIEEGDTIESVASRNNISTVQLEFANNIEEDSLLVPGAELNVTEIEYALNFSYPILEDKIEEIAFEIEYQDDVEKYKDEEEVLQEGINGSAHATYWAYIINGVSEPGERTEYKVIQEPLKQIVKRGTKERPAANAGGTAWSVGTDAPYANEAGFIWPATGICVSAEYGYYEYGRHNGLDIAGNPGDQIWAAAAGTVEIASYNGAFGNHVRVNHHNGLVTTYSHMSSIGVNKGQEVSQGTYLGGMGRTGFADGTHLHFEVEADGARLNPRGYLPAGGPSSC